MATGPGPRPQRRGSDLRGWSAGLAAALAVGVLAQTDAFWGFEERALAVSLKASGGRSARADVVVVEFRDEDYLRWDNAIPRASQARVLDALTAAGVRVLAFDFDYSTVSREGVAGDAVLGAALARGGRAVTGTACLSGATDKYRDWPPADRALPSGPTPALECAGFARPGPEVERASTPAHFQLVASASGIVRSVYLLAEANGRRLPALALAAWLRGRGLEAAALEQAPGEVRVQGLVVPVGPRGEVALSWRPGTRRYGLGQLLDRVDPATGRFDDALAAELSGAYVLVGAAWDVLGDRGPLVTGDNEALVHAHALLLQDLLDGRPLRDAPRPWALLQALVAGALLALAAQRLSTGRGLAALLALAAAAAWQTELGVRAGVYLGPLAPFLAGVAAWGVATARRLADREAERRLLRGAFGAYVDPQMLERLLAEPARYLALSGARKEVTVMFSDLVGFTRITNQLAPELVVSVLREYLAAMSRIVVVHGGRVDKIMGDGILAVFGDPQELEDHAGAGVRAALAMREELARLGARWRAEGKPELQCRTGLASGEVFVGNVGAVESKLEYTVLGAVVNLASRLEGRAPHGCVLVSAGTRARVQQAFELAPAPPLALKGFDAPQEAWLLMGPLATSESLRRHTRVPVSIPVKLRAGRGAWVDGVATNASATGVFVEVALEVAGGSEVEVAVPARDGLAKTYAARVRWRGAAAGSKVGLGLEFADGADQLAVLFGLDERRNRPG